MSDEFFFDDDAVEEKAAKKKAAPKKAPSKTSNNKKNTTANKAGKAAPKATPKAAPKTEPKETKGDVAPAEEALSATWTITIMAAVISLLIGAIGGIFIGRSLAPKVVYDSSSINTSNGMDSMMGGGMDGSTTDGTTSGEMPSGHPDISTMEGAGSDSGTSGN